jgi:hypothetical protein
MKKNALLTVVALFATIIVTSCGKGGKTPEQLAADSTRIADSLAKIEALKPQNLIAKAWKLSNAEIGDTAKKEVKARLEVMKQAVSYSFTKEGDCSFTDVDPKDAKKTVTMSGKWSLSEDGTSLYVKSVNEKDKKEKTDTLGLSISESELSITRKNGEKLIFVPAQ